MQEHGRFISLLGFLSLHPDHGDGGTGSELWLCCIYLLTTCVSLQVAFTSYGDQSKRQRRLLHQAFGIQAIPAYYPLLQIETVAFLRRLAADPSKYESHTRRYAGGLTLSVVYGYEVKSSEDELLQLAEECVDLLANHIASGCGIWPVDIIPALQYLPDWVPGSGFKRKAAKWKVKFEELVGNRMNMSRTAWCVAYHDFVATTLCRIYRRLVTTKTLSARLSSKMTSPRLMRNLNLISNGLPTPCIPPALIPCVVSICHRQHLI